MHHKQGGMTAIGFILIAMLVGVIGLGVLKVGPMYAQGLRLEKVLGDLKEEMDGTNPTPNRVRLALERRLDIESLRIPRDQITIRKGGPGYVLRVNYDNKAHFVANVWLMVVVDEQIEVVR